MALPYGTTADKKYWYICPRYWCVKTNRPMTDVQLKNGECGGQKTADDKNVIEFTDEKEHTDSEGNYRQHRPGFLENDAHPNSNYCFGEGGASHSEQNVLSICLCKYCLLFVLFYV